MLLEVNGLCVNYGRVEALRGVSLTVDTGEVVALVGSNGAGKTTLMKTLSGLRPVRSGTATLDGEDLFRLSPDERVSRGLVHVPEGRHLFPGLSVRENLQLGAHRSRDASRRRLNWRQVTDLFPPLTKLMERSAGLLSGGEQQMVAIGRALMGNPRLLTLDEPSLGLAPLVVETMFDAISAINRAGVAVLLVEQNATKALQLAHRGYVLELGAVVEEGPAGQLTASTRIVEAYLGGGVRG